jgi:hypothetical protein
MWLQKVISKNNLKVNVENSRIRIRIRIRTKMSRIRNTVFECVSYENARGLSQKNLPEKGGETLFFRQTP